MAMAPAAPLINWIGRTIRRIDTSWIFTARNIRYRLPLNIQLFGYRIPLDLQLLDASGTFGYLLDYSNLALWILCYLFGFFLDAAATPNWCMQPPT